jgi:uncharacterized membrane protein YccC
MFFAFLAFVISVATFMLTWKDGRLADNARSLMHEARETLAKANEQKLSDSESAQRLKVREQLDRYAGMIRDGDGQVRFYLDGLRTDLERLRDYGSEESADWLGEAAATVEEARQQLRDDAPAAARKLRDLSGKLGSGEGSVNATIKGAGEKLDAARETLGGALRGNDLADEAPAPESTNPAMPEPRP